MFNLHLHPSCLLYLALMFVAQLYGYGHDERINAKPRAKPVSPLVLTTGDQGVLHEGPKDANGNRYFCGFAHRFLNIGSLRLNLHGGFAFSVDAHNRMRWFTPLALDGRDILVFAWSEGLLYLELDADGIIQIELQPQTGTILSQITLPWIVEDADVTQTPDGGN